ncbi:MAG: response regulator, partial [Microcystaceae cyanobacterium]
MVEKATPANILLVDDATENLSLLKALLKPLGHRILTATNGQQALSLVDQETFSLIILDVRMPGLDGFETAAQIQQQCQQKHPIVPFIPIPIIFLTATADAEDDIFHGYQLGAIDYIIKPFNSKLLLNKVTNFIQFFQQQQTLFAQNLTLQSINEELHNQYQECQRIEQELQQATIHLEELVAERAQSLQKSETLYRTVLSQISDTVFITDNDGNFTFVCPNVDYIWGYHQEDIMNMKNIRELLGIGLTNAESLSLHDQVVNIEQRILDRHGLAHDLLINVKRVDIQGGSLLYSCRDVTNYTADEGL